MDSFRLVRYEMSTGKPSCVAGSILLQQRHNAAPGMVLVSKTTAGSAQCRVSMFPLGGSSSACLKLKRGKYEGDVVRRNVVSYCPYQENQTVIIKVAVKDGAS